MRPLPFIAFVAALLVLASPAGARVILVPWEHQSIQEGLNAAVDGDTVLVTHGTYYENVRFHGKEVLLTTYVGGGESAALPTDAAPEWTRGDLARDEVVIDGSFPSNPDSSAAVYFVDGEGAGSIIRGFTITHEGFRRGRGRANGEGIVCDRASPTIEDNLIVGNSPNGIRYRDEGGDRRLTVVGNEIRWNATPGFGGGITIEQSIGPYGSNALIWGNLIAGNTAGAGGAIAIRWAQGSRVVVRENMIFGNTANHGAGIWTEKGHSDLIVERNVFADNAGAAIIVADYDPGTNLMLTNNTIAGNDDGVALMFGHEAVITNNIVVLNGSGISRGGFQKLSLSHNDVWENGGSDYVGCSPGPGDISEDPLFVGGVPMSYRLTAGSPCIDAGDPSSPLDPDGTPADMGALYYHQTTGVPEAGAVRPTLAIRPNPCPGRAAISLVLPLPADRLDVAIHDVSGRLTRRLRSGPASAGTIQVVWDGRTETGHDAASGVYFCRITADGVALGAPLVVLR